MKKRIPYPVVVIVLSIFFSLSSVAFNEFALAETKKLDADQIWVVDKTHKLTGLIVEEGAVIKAPEGYSLSMTVDSVQKDILPGTYQGDIVLNVTEDNVVNFWNRLTHYFRQALYVGKDGVMENKSVLSAVSGGEVTDTYSKNIRITSRGENFNGIYVADGATYRVENATIDFVGNGSNDFAGYGAAVMSTGDNTVLVVDHSEIRTQGVVRTTAIAGAGSRLIIKNSTIQARDGVLPPGYIANGSPGNMWTEPWVLGIAGNVRATSVIGDSPTAVYLNSSITSQGWGVLSTDSCRNARLFAINCKVQTQENGYGTYSDGNSVTNSFYGCDLDVDGYGAITTGGTVNYNATTPEKMSGLNTSLELGLTDAELAAMPEKQTIVKSGRFGVMFHIGRGTVNVMDGTVFDCKEAVFLIRGASAEMNVDGSGGARLISENGTIMQVMDRDRTVTFKDPDTGLSRLDTFYTEPYADYADVVKDSTHDPFTAVNSRDVIGNYENMALNGNFYNAITGIEGDERYPSRNLILNLNNVTVRGVISSAFARHPKRTFGEDDWQLIGKVANTPCAAINNGVIVSLDESSSWTVTGTSYLTKLVLTDGAVLTAPDGKNVTMTVDGVQKDILPGTYQGNIVLTVSEDNAVEYQDQTTYHFRQALYVDSTGVVGNKSVTAAVKGGQVTDIGAKNITITSGGENFNGIFVTGGGTYTVEGAKIDFTGNGGNDFVGYGAAVMSAGDHTTFILDNAEIKTRGVVRTAVIASGGNLVVKNSKIETHDGVLTEAYLNTVKAPMVTGPWTLGIAGNVRATSVIGDGATATYINSNISSDGWGVLSTDACRNARLTAINCEIFLAGDNGYGTFADGPSTTNSFYGCRFDVPDHGAIISGTINFGASTADNVSEINSSLKLGLADKEIAALEERQTVVNSGRFGILFSKGTGIANIKDGTVFNTQKAVFLVQGTAAEINVDGTNGVLLQSGNGIILQVMDRDRVSGHRDPETGRIVRDPYYSEPYAAHEDIVRDTTHDVTVAGRSDIIGNYRNIELNGDFYNGRTGIEGREDYPSSNLVLDFKNAQITGVISATFATHAKRTFGKSDYKLIGEVSNTPRPAVNNGVIVSLDADSLWTVTGTSYLTKLAIAKGATVTATPGDILTMTVNGVTRPVEAGTYRGAIVLTVASDI